MDLKNVIDQPNTVIVDVREPYEFSAGHVEGAINIPLSATSARLEEYQDMGRPIILYCRSGNRSGQVAHFLKAKGINEVYNAGSLEDVEFLLSATA